MFDFSHVTKVLDACEREGLYVIVGTPTYAIPAWMAKAYPEVMVTDRSGRRPYGARQIMDITHPAYRFCGTDYPQADGGCGGLPVCHRFSAG